MTKHGNYTDSRKSRKTYFIYELGGELCNFLEYMGVF